MESGTSRGSKPELELVFADVCPRCRDEDLKVLYVSGEQACRACTSDWVDGDELVDKQGRVWLYWPFPSDFIEKASNGVIEVECPRCASKDDGECDCDEGEFETALDEAYLNGKVRLRRPGYVVENAYATPASVGFNIALMSRDKLELKLVVDRRVGDTAADRATREAIRVASEPHRNPSRFMRHDMKMLVNQTRAAFDAVQKRTGDACVDERLMLDNAYHAMERAAEVLEANEKTIAELIARVQIRFERVVQEGSGDGESEQAG